MAEIITVSLVVEVNDPAALWDKAARYMADTGWSSVCAPSDRDGVIGTRDRPDLGACLQMLLDRSENLDGAEIEESSTDWDGPDEDEENSEEEE